MTYDQINEFLLNTSKLIKLIQGSIFPCLYFYLFIFYLFFVGRKDVGLYMYISVSCLSELSDEDTRSNMYNSQRDRAVAMSSANGLVGTGFASRYRLQPISGF